MNKKKKEMLLAITNEVNIRPENLPLYIAKQYAKGDATGCVPEHRRDEETKWARWAKVKHVY
jgi:hypothetical protein